MAIADGMAIAEVWLLGISALQFETGAAGTTLFEPGGVFFWHCRRDNLRGQSRSGWGRRENKREQRPFWAKVISGNKISPISAR
jgi:hypothetical protein